MSQPQGSYAPVLLRSSFHFQPGGTAAGNIYVTWAALYADLIKTQGHRDVTFEATYATVTMPAGTYDLSGCYLRGVNGPAGENVVLYLADGCVWSRLPPCITDSLNVTSQSNSPIWTSPSTGTATQGLLELGVGGQISCTGNAEFFKVSGSGGTGDSLIVLIGTAAQITFVSYEVFNLVNSGAMVVFGVNGATLSTQTVRSDATGFFILDIASGSFTYSTTNPNFTGFVVALLIDVSLYHYYNNSVSGLTAGNVQAAIDEISAGATTINLAKYDSAANSSTTETDMTSKAMPAGDLLADLDGYFIRAGGAFAANINSKRVRMYFGATVIADTGSVVLNGGRWYIEGRLYRSSSTTQKAFSNGHTTLAGLIEFSSATTPAEILGNSITIKCTGQGGATSDVTQDFMDIFLIKGAT